MIALGPVLILIGAVIVSITVIADVMFRRLCYQVARE